jgi:hypothetical protein
MIIVVAISIRCVRQRSISVQPTHESDLEADDFSTLQELPELGRRTVSVTEGLNILFL